jgi:acyl-CoA synthetase (AMP-forming)/AMP-acid ligase II
MPSVGIYKTYGQTETFRSSILRPDEYAAKITSAGRPVTGTEVFIVNQKGMKAAPDEIGEIIHRGDGIMLGYVDDERETRKKIKPDPLRAERALGSQKVIYTGDMGKIDKDGYLYIVGRKDNMIKISGYRVYPKEITDQVISCGSVRDAVAFGMSDEKTGTTICCVVEPRPGVTVDVHELKKYLSKRLPSYMVPATIVIHDSLPRTSSGKIRLSKVRDRCNAQG